ncbi:endo alpha-1,4 polygalactosaminidase [Hydrogenimonas sp.]
MLILLGIMGCGGGGGGEDSSQRLYPLHTGITSTVFWIGEKADASNGGIANLSSAWDEKWTARYGGVDSPDHRDGYRPAGFIPRENPFYVALPFNDFDENGVRKAGLEKRIPWYEPGLPEDRSYCKNRWVEIAKGDRKVYAQWEDAGPFGENDAAYVFGDASPRNALNDHAGIDLSPAVRDYLGAEDIDEVEWRFVDAEDVPGGPWKEIVTVSGVDWPLWYRPDVNTTWQWQLSGRVNLSYDVELYDIDLFDSEISLIDALHDAGRRVVCYFSAGSFEAWREDAGNFPPEVLGRALEGWEGERWLDIRSPEVRKIVERRLDLAVEKGCDGVEPDNVDGYTNETGFPLTYTDQLDYNRFLADEAHRRGLSIALKNDLEQIEDLRPWFDFALNESCHLYDECDRLKPFVDVGKPVFNAEYSRVYLSDPSSRASLCEDAEKRGFHTLILPPELDDTYRYSCR